MQKESFVYKLITALRHRKWPEQLWWVEFNAHTHVDVGLVPIHVRNLVNLCTETGIENVKLKKTIDTMRIVGPAKTKLVDKWRLGEVQFNAQQAVIHAMLAEKFPVLLTREPDEVKHFKNWKVGY